MQQAFTIKEFAPIINSAEFQKSYLFKIALPSFYSENLKGDIIPSDKIIYCASSTSFPSSSTGIQTIPFYNSEIKIGTKTVFDPWTLTFKFDKVPFVKNDFYGCNYKNGEKVSVGNSYTYFYHWRKCVHNLETYTSDIPQKPIKNGETVKGYKHFVILWLMDESNYVDGYFVLTGAWPSSISGSNFDYSSDEISTFNVTFSFDNFIYSQA